MTKTIKLSLAAVMAAGIATSASAQNLEDAIKGVDVSGYVDYRKEYKSTEGKKSLDVNEYAVNVTLTSKVNDMVKATVAVGFDEVQTANTGSTGIAGDADPSLNVSNAFFTFDLGKTAVMAGKQAIPSVFVDQVDTGKAGTGLVAQHTVSDALTLVGAHFTNTNFAFEAKTTELVAVGSAAGLSYEARYNTTDVVAAEADRLYFKVGAKVADISLTGKYASASQDGTNGNTTKYDDSSVMSLTAAGKVASASVSATYFTADKSGVNTATDVAIDGDNDAQAHVKVWQLSTAAISGKGDGIALGGSMPVADKLTLGLTYAVASDDVDAAAAVAAVAKVDGTISGTKIIGGTDAVAAKAAVAAHTVDYSELLISATYKMSKNFTLHARYSMLGKDTGTTDTTTDYSRIQVKYTF